MKNTGEAGPLSLNDLANSIFLLSVYCTPNFSSTKFLHTHIHTHFQYYTYKKKKCKSPLQLCTDIAYTPESIGHAVRPESPHEDELLERALALPLLWELLFFRTLRLHHLLPAFRRALDVSVEPPELVCETHRLPKDRHEQTLSFVLIVTEY